MISLENTVTSTNRPRRRPRLFSLPRSDTMISYRAMLALRHSPAMLRFCQSWRDTERRSPLFCPLTGGKCRPSIAPLADRCRLVCICFPWLSDDEKRLALLCIKQASASSARGTLQARFPLQANLRPRPPRMLALVRLRNHHGEGGGGMREEEVVGDVEPRPRLSTYAPTTS